MCSRLLQRVFRLTRNTPRAATQRSYAVLQRTLPATAANIAQRHGFQLDWTAWRGIGDNSHKKRKDSFAGKNKETAELRRMDVNEQFFKRIEQSKMNEIGDQQPKEEENGAQQPDDHDYKLSVTQAHIGEILFREVSIEDPQAPKLHNYWRLLKDRGSWFGEAAVFQTLREIRALGLLPDDFTLMHYVLPNIPDTAEPVKIYAELKTTGVTDQQALFHTLLHQIHYDRLHAATEFCRNHDEVLDTGALLPKLIARLKFSGRTDKEARIATLLIALQNSAEDPLFDMAGALLIELLDKRLGTSEYHAKNLECFKRCLHEFELQRVDVSPAAIDSLLAKLPEFRCTDEELAEIEQRLGRLRNVLLTNLPASQNYHNVMLLHRPYDLTENFEILCTKMEARGMEHAGVLRRLMELTIHDGNLERGAQLKARCEELGVPMDYRAMLALLQLAIFKGDQTTADTFMQQIEQKYPMHIIDEHVMIDYARLWVVNGRYMDALELLEKRAEQMPIMGGRFTNGKMSNFLRAVSHFGASIAATDELRNYTLEAFNRLYNHGYCKFERTMLKPVIAETVMRGDLKTAVREFTQLVEQYKISPMHNELLFTLATLRYGSVDAKLEYPHITEDEAAGLLGDVMTAMSNLYGADDANASLMLSLADAGLIDEIAIRARSRKYPFNVKYIHKSCEYFAKVGKYEMLRNLADGLLAGDKKALVSDMYRIMMNTFAAKNDWQAALDLFNTIDAIKPPLILSPSFMPRLLRLLEDNLIDIPNNVLTRAESEKLSITSLRATKRIARRTNTN